MADREEDFVRRTLLVAAIIVSIILVLLLIAFAADILLMGFAGILLSLFLRGISTPIARVLHVSNTLALVITILLLVSFFVISVWLLAPDVVDQVGKMKEQIPEAADTLKKYILTQNQIQDLLQKAPDPASLLQSRIGVLRGITGVFSATFAFFVNILIIIILGLYLAFEPDTYINGFLKLIAPARREHARRIIDSIGSILGRWLMGRLLSMSIIGFLTWLGLLVLGIPLALTLSLLAALLTFIPNIGPVLSVLPAALLALLKGPDFALYVLFLYVAIQTVESYVITPVIQRYAVSLPPALTILAQIILGLMLGFLGLVLATPLTAAMLVLVNQLYIRDVLQDEREMRGNR